MVRLPNPKSLLASCTVVLLLVVVLRRYSGGTCETAAACFLHSSFIHPGKPPPTTEDEGRARERVVTVTMGLACRGWPPLVTRPCLRGQRLGFEQVPTISPGEPVPRREPRQHVAGRCLVLRAPTRPAISPASCPPSGQPVRTRQSPSRKGNTK